MIPRHLCKALLPFPPFARGEGPKPSLSLGISGLDEALGGGRVHELTSSVFQRGAAAGFALALASAVQKPGDILWAQQDFAKAENGEPYGPGAAHFGIAPSRLLILRAAHGIDVLWAMEEAFRCSGIAVVMGELDDERALDLTATRRLSLAAEKSDALGLLLRSHRTVNPSAAATRWEVAAAPSRPDEFGGLGRPRFALRLVKNKYGPVGEWVVEWSSHEKRFRTAAHPRIVAAPPSDRPYSARQAG